MKTLLRLTLGTGMALAWGAASFGQHYTQTNLVANTPGIAPVTDPQLVNPWGISRTSGSLLTTIETGLLFWSLPREREYQCNPSGSSAGSVNSAVASAGRL